MAATKTDKGQNQDPDPKAQGIRQFLLSEFIARRNRNTHYSLRAFARSLAIDPSELSKLLRGGRPIGKKITLRLAKRLGCSPNETRGLLERCEGRCEAGARASGDVVQYRQLELDY